MSGYGQPAPGAAPAYGQPAPGAAPAYGQPAPGTAPAYGQPAPGTAPAYGQPTYGQSAAGVWQAPGGPASPFTQPGSYGQGSSVPDGQAQPGGGQFQPSAVMPAAVPPPPPDGRWRPERVDPVAGTEFGLVRLQVPPIASGLATGSLIAGIASIGVSFLVLCFGLAGSSDNWGGWVAGAFALLGVLRRRRGSDARSGGAAADPALAPARPDPLHRPRRGHRRHLMRRCRGGNLGRFAGVGTGAAVVLMTIIRPPHRTAALRSE